MSKHTIEMYDYESGDTDVFEYGYDRPFQTYFLAHKRQDSEQFEPIVGFDGVIPGNTSGLMQAFRFFGITDRVPQAHLALIAMDLPIP